MWVDDVEKEYIAQKNENILVTGASGFIGCHVVDVLLKKGFTSIKCLVRQTSDISRLELIISNNGGNGRVEIIEGNLLSSESCRAITENISIVYHLAAAMGTKIFSEAYLNSVVTTKNLLEALINQRSLKRFVNVSSFIVYSGPRGRGKNIIDELSPVEREPEKRSQAYCYGKVKQDEIVISYGEKYGLPYVIVRPGTVYGPGKAFIPPRVGTDTFGLFIHLGGSNKLPLTYVTNCAEAIVLAGLVAGIEKEVFNIVDDDLPTSREFLREYKKYVKRFKSIYIPHILSYLLYYAWEKFANWSKGQLPLVYTRREWWAIWKKVEFKNNKIKEKLGWRQSVSTREGLNMFFDYCRRYYKINSN